jgi:hypothetical protein
MRLFVRATFERTNKTLSLLSIPKDAGARRMLGIVALLLGLAGLGLTPLWPRASFQPSPALQRRCCFTVLIASQISRFLASLHSPPQSGCYGGNLRHERGEVGQVKRLAAIRARPVGVGMHFKDQAVGAGGDRCQGERRHKVPLAGAVARVGDHRQVRAPFG